MLCCYLWDLSDLQGRFIWSINAHGYADHIDGPSVAPANPVTWTDVAQALTATKAAVEVEWKKELKTIYKDLPQGYCTRNLGSPHRGL